MPRLEGIDLYLAGMRDHHKALSVARRAVTAKIVPPEDEVAVYVREIEHIVAQRVMRGELVHAAGAGPRMVAVADLLSGRPN